MTEIPKLTGGTWNASEAVSPDGNLVLVAGDSTSYPNGEVYVYNASTCTTTPLGSPNRPWEPLNFGGMTADGAVAAVTFGGPTRGFGYFRNSHGWFHLTSALGARGIDIKAQGWTEFTVMGISPDGTLVFGSGAHNDTTEGFVAEFPAGYLAAFDVPAVAPSDTSIVGAWHVSDTDSGSPAIVVFMADGTYYIIQRSVQPTETNAAVGLERGVYAWNAATGAFLVTTMNDTNGDAGLSDNNGVLNATLFVSGDTISVAAGGPSVGTRIKAPSAMALKDTLVGGWVIGNPAAADSSTVVVFDADGKYYLAQHGPVAAGGHDGVEEGTFTWDASSHILAATSITADTNGDWGLSDPIGAITMLPFIDGLVATAGDTTGLMTAYRIIDPNSVIPAITSPLTASGTFGTPFSYTARFAAAKHDADRPGSPGLSAVRTLTDSSSARTIVALETDQPLMRPLVQESPGKPPPLESPG